MAQADFDVAVVGAGNAALCAALAAREGAERVIVLERAPESERGGNSHFTAGLVRLPYEGADDLRALVGDWGERRIEVGPLASDGGSTIANLLSRKRSSDSIPHGCGLGATESIGTDHTSVFRDPLRRAPTRRCAALRRSGLSRRLRILWSDSSRRSDDTTIKEVRRTVPRR